MTGHQFTLTNMDWFSGLQAGDTLELDYQMTFAGEVQPSITSMSLNGQDACSGTGPAVTTSVSTSMPTTGKIYIHYKTGLVLMSWYCRKYRGDNYSIQSFNNNSRHWRIHYNRIWIYLLCWEIWLWKSSGAFKLILWSTEVWWSHWWQ